MGYKYETAAPDRYDLLKEFAKENRRKMTESETILWEKLRKELTGYRFRRQHPIGDYIADFICIPAKIIIEVDGAYHNKPEQLILDESRSDFLIRKGYQVLRFKNEEISNNLEEVMTRIKNILFNKGNYAPRPLERGWG